MTKPKPLPPLSRLNELCDYDPLSGVMRWKINERKRRAGNKVGSVNTAGYLVCSIDGVMYYVHRIAWAICNNSIDGHLQIDHINGNRSDNRICNLRACDNAQNNWNKALTKGNSSGIKGAFLDKRDGRWYARITVRNVRKSLGGYDTPELAHMAYCKAAAELHGEFARGS